MKEAFKIRLGRGEDTVLTKAPDVLLAHCDKSPTQVHYWKLDIMGNGYCKFCHQVRDYRPPEVKITERDKGLTYLDVDPPDLNGYARIHSMTAGHATFEEMLIKAESGY